MMSLVKELLEYVGDSTMIIYVSLAAMALTVITHFIFRKYSRFIKYLPGILILLMGIYSLYTVLDSILETESFGELMFSITFVVSGFVGIFSALILGVYHKPKKTRKKKNPQSEQKEQKA